MTVYKRDIRRALELSGIHAGDTLLVHSSLKSMGYVDGGPDAVIDACLEALGPSGTLVMPTLIQKNFPDAYRTWHLDKPSDVGLITETFRQRPESIRSDQATHSVAAQGPLAEFLTRDHGKYGRRIGAFGDTPFAVCSPWQKLYDLNAKVLLLGVTMKSNTCKHLTEYQMVDDLLSYVDDDEVRASLAARLRDHSNYTDPSRVWLFSSGEKCQAAVTEAGLLRQTLCGDAVFTVYRVKDTNDHTEKLFYSNPAAWYGENVVLWLNDAIRAGSYSPYRLS
ncbi:MAG: AAC(3) family N-acetyltransferase [Clostridiaceae bacterium]|nr:AAC(3) family N-acetyltransferase [Clostridiaceae bacterium]